MLHFICTGILTHIMANAHKYIINVQKLTVTNLLSKIFLQLLELQLVRKMK